MQYYIFGHNSFYYHIYTNKKQNLNDEKNNTKQFTDIRY